MENETIKKLLSDFEPSHSEFQIENFIIGNAGCVWSQYKQALREVDSRYYLLKTEKENLELSDLKLKLFWPFGRRAKIKSGQRRRKRKILLARISEIERELVIFVDLAIKLKSAIGDLDPLKRQVLEADSWRLKALRMAGIDLLVNGRIGQSTMELVLALPRKDRTDVLKILSPDAKPNPMKLIGK